MTAIPPELHQRQATRFFTDAFGLSILGREPGDVASSGTPDGSSSAMALRGWLLQSLLLEAIMRNEVGDGAAAGRALERALELAEPDRVLMPFLVQPIPELLARHARPQTARTQVIAEISDLLEAIKASRPPASLSLREPLTEAETRVLRLLATDLSRREIGAELYLSVDNRSRRGTSFPRIGRPRETVGIGTSARETGSARVAIASVRIRWPAARLRRNRHLGFDRERADSHGLRRGAVTWPRLGMS